ncbi:Integrase core domain containing protein [Dirofilaria immitis]|nr:Integrase core domain containing protein [Dirofilaria immitis]
MVWKNIYQEYHEVVEYTNELLDSLKRECTQKELVSPRFVGRIPHENEIVLLNEPEVPRGVFSGIPFSIPENWKKVIVRNVTLHKVEMYIRTHITIPAIKCSEITRTVYAKAFRKLSLSVVSD